jgi:hypothetical protein
MTININHFSSPTAYSSTPYNNVPYYLFASGPMLAIRLRTDASNLYFDLSGTMGRTWTQIYTEAKTTFFTVGPDQQGIGLNTTGAALYLYSYTEN